MSDAPVRILLIDDEESDFLVARALLGQIEEPPMEVEWSATFDEGLGRLSEHDHDVCLLDYFLGEDTGLDLLRTARSRGVRTPVILLTGKGSREVDLEAMRAGAVDYLQKGISDPEVMERAIRYAVERHRALEELRRSEERHRGMFDHLPLGLFRVSAEGEYMEANPALIRTLEYPDRDTIRRVHAHNYFVSPRDRERFSRALTDRGVVLGFESELRTASGRPVRVRNTARVHRGAGGRIEYVEGTVEDVTERVSPRDLEEEAGAFRTVREIAPTGIVMADLEGRVRSVNPALEQVLGRDEAAMVGGAIWDLVHSDDAAQMARNLDAVADDGRIRGKIRLISSSGRTVTSTMAAAAVRGPDGAPRAVLFVLDGLGAGGTE